MAYMKGLYYKLVRDAKRDILTAALKAYDGNRVHTAKAIGVPRTYLIRLINELGVDVPSKGKP